MNEIVKNEYTEIKKYFDDYYKEQLEIYERGKYNDNYLLTELTIYWLVSFLALLVTAILAEKNKLSDLSVF